MENNGNAINSGRGVVAKNNCGFGAANSVVNNNMSGSIQDNNNSRPVIGFGTPGSSTFSFNNQGNNLALSQCNPNTLNNRQDHSQNRNNLDRKLWLSLWL